MRKLLAGGLAISIISAASGAAAQSYSVGFYPDFGCGLVFCNHPKIYGLSSSPQETNILNSYTVGQGRRNVALIWNDGRRISAVIDFQTGHLATTRYGHRKWCISRSDSRLVLLTRAACQQQIDQSERDLDRDEDEFGDY